MMKRKVLNALWIVMILCGITVSIVAIRPAIENLTTAAMLEEYNLYIQKMPKDTTFSIEEHGTVCAMGHQIWASFVGPSTFLFYIGGLLGVLSLIGLFVNISVNRTDARPQQTTSR